MDEISTSSTGGRATVVILPEVQAWMTDLITTRFREQNPIRDAEILDTLQYARGITLSGDSLRHRVRGMPTVKSVIGV
jgi:hypothetical protein